MTKKIFYMLLLFGLSQNLFARNSPPYLKNSLPDIEIKEDDGDKALFGDLNAYFADEDGDELSFNIFYNNADAGNCYLEGSALRFEPAPDWFGRLDVRVSASDGTTSASNWFSIEVLAVNDAPRKTKEWPVFELTEDEGRQIIIADLNEYFEDPEGNAITYGLLPEGDYIGSSIIDGKSLQIDPEQDFEGTFLFEIIADDGQAQSYETMELFFEAVNDTPRLYPPDTLLFCAGESNIFSLAEWADDPESGEKHLNYQLLSTTLISGSGNITSGISGYELNVTAEENSEGFWQILFSATDEEGAVQEAAFYLSVNSLDAAITRDGETLQVAESGAAYQWFLNSSPIEDAGEQSLHVAESGHYSVRIEKNTCSTLSESYYISDEVLSLESMAQILGTKAYPNPSVNGFFTVTLPQTIGKGFYKVVDAQGKTLASNSFYTKAITIDLSQNKDGLYFLILNNQNGLRAVRLLKGGRH